MMAVTRSSHPPFISKDGPPTVARLSATAPRACIRHKPRPFDYSGLVRPIGPLFRSGRQHPFFGPAISASSYVAPHFARLSVYLGAFYRVVSLQRLHTNWPFQTDKGPSTHLFVRGYCSSLFATTCRPAPRQVYISFNDHVQQQQQQFDVD